jgi:hypothetical protein
MTLAVGKCETLVPQKHRIFDGYDVWGTWVADVQHKRGWIIRLSGLDNGSFVVCNGEIREAGWGSVAGSSRGASVEISPEIADIRASAKKAIFDAITLWEKEEIEGPPDL